MVGYFHCFDIRFAVVEYCSRIIGIGYIVVRGLKYLLGLHRLGQIEAEFLVRIIFG